MFLFSLTIKPESVQAGRLMRLSILQKLVPATLEGATCSAFS
jgi:hypothetical protein